MATTVVSSTYAKANNAAMVLYPGTQYRMKVRGLQGLGLCTGFSQSATAVPSLDQQIAPKYFGGGEYEETTISVNYIPGEKSQEELRKLALSGEMLKNMRLYTKEGCHFAAPDQISAGGGLASGTSGYNIGSWTTPSAASGSDIFANSVTIVPAGACAMFIAHTPALGGAAITTSTGVDTIELTLSSGSWVDYGFEVDDTILIDGDATDAADDTPKYAKCMSVSETVLAVDDTLGDAASIVIGVLSAKATIHGATPSLLSSDSIVC